MNRWAADVVRNPPAALSDVYQAALADITGTGSSDSPDGATAIQVQNILRHALSEVISAEIINVLMVTNSAEANIQLTRIHEHLFSRAFDRTPLKLTLLVLTCDPSREPRRRWRLAPPNILCRRRVVFS